MKETPEEILNSTAFHICAILYSFFFFFPAKIQDV